MSKEPIGGTLGVEVLIQAEKAAGLKYAGRALEEAQAKAEALAARAADAVGEARARLVAEHDAARAEFDKRRWYLVVQREAMGLWNHDDLDILYPPPRRLLR